MVGTSKLSNNNSIFSKNSNEKISEAKFEEVANKSFNDHEDRKKKCVELGARFLTILNDRTLKDNTSPIAKDLERQIVSELCELATVINNDEFESEGMGSLAIITLLLKSVLMQRDKINELLYKIQQLELSLPNAKQ